MFKLFYDHLYDHRTRHPMKIRVMKHEAVPGCGSYEVRFPDRRPSKYFYFETSPVAGCDLIVSNKQSPNRRPRGSPARSRTSSIRSGRKRSDNSRATIPNKSPARRSGADVSSHDQRGTEPDTRNKPRACDAVMTGRRRLGHQMRRRVASIMAVRTLRAGGGGV